jgi:signal peptidase II
MTPVRSSPWPVLGVIVAAVAVVADQLSKYVMVDLVMRPEGVTETPYYTAKVIELLPFFQLRLSWNTGMSFSLFNSGEAATVAMLLAGRIIITLGLIWWMWRLDGRWMQVACGLVVGGAVGNIIDQATVGAVADFLDFYWGAWHFPTFNLADTCITVGAGMWLLDAFLARPHDTAQLKDPAP